MVWLYRGEEGGLAHKCCVFYEFEGELCYWESRDSFSLEKNSKCYEIFQTQKLHIFQQFNWILKLKNEKFFFFVGIPWRIPNFWNGHHKFSGGRIHSGFSEFPSRIFQEVFRWFWKGIFRAEMMVNLGNLNWIFQCFSHLEQVDWKRFLAWIFAEMFIWIHSKSLSVWHFQKRIDPSSKVTFS